MGAHDEELLRRLDDLTRRIEAIEEAVGVPSPEAAPTESASEQSVPEIATPRIETPPAAPPTVAPEPERIAPTWGEKIKTVHTEPAARVRRHRPRIDRARLEKNIGQIAFAAGGALLAIIGAGLFLKLGIEREWFSFPPVARCIAGAGFGAVLLAIGEIVRRRIGRAGAEGLFAAGLGTLYVAAYATYGLYGLVGDGVAFALLVAVAAIGIGISALSSMVRVAGLSLLGGYIAPFLLTPDAPNPLVLPSHLLVLLAIGLALSLWRPSPFRWLRGPVWAATMLIGSFWILWQGPDVPLVAGAFLGAVWGAVHGELVLSARPVGRRPDEPMDSSPVRRLSWRDARRLAMSISTTLFGAGWGVYVLQYGAVALDDWMAPAAFLIASIFIGLTLAGTLRLLRDEVTSERERLGAGLLLQAGALLIVVVALALAGWAQAVTWLALALAGFGSGRWVRSRGLLVYASVLLGIGVARILLIDPLGGLASSTGSVMGLVTSRWMALVVGASASCALGAWLVRRPDWRPGRIWAEALGSISLVLAIIAMVHFEARGESMGWAVIALGGVGAVVARLARMNGLKWTALSAVSLGALAGVAGVLAGEGVGVNAQGLVFTEWTLLAVGAGGVFFAGWWVNGMLRTAQQVGSVALGCAALLLAAFSHPDADPTWVAGAWGAVALLALAGARAIRGSWAPSLAILLLVVASVRAVVTFGPDWLEHEGTPLAYAGLWICVLISAGLLVGPVLMRGRGLRREVIAASTWIGLGLLLGATSLEAARAASILASDPTAERAAVSIWWGVFGTALIAIGFGVRSGPTRIAGLALVGIGALKAVLWDLAGVAPEWRVASFLILGVLMLGVAAAYVGLQRLLRKREEAELGSAEGAG